MGSRVVGLVRAGAWAELAAVSTADLAVVPDAVSDVQAAALPTAGATALRALEVAGLLVGKRVLVIGATGGVGRLAVQLAHASGARVTALVRRGADVGADEVVTEIRGTFDVIVDAVGGDAFGAAIEHLRPRGVVVNLATGSAEEVVTFRAARFDRAAGARIYTLNLVDELVAAGGAAKDLERLVDLVARGVVDPPIGREASWHETDHAIAALLDRAFDGKAVLRIDR